MLSIRPYALLASAVVTLAACGGGGSTNTGGGGNTTGTGASTGSGASTTTSGTTTSGSTTTSGTTTSGSTTTSGTTSTTSTTSAASGACTDAADTAQLATIGSNLQNLVQGCAQNNLEQEPATKNCIKQMTMLSDGCVTCFDNNVQCAAQHCLGQCIVGMSSMCTMCLHTNCTPAFNTCSGLMGP